MWHVRLAALWRLATALSIVEAPWEARQSNLLRVTRESCDDCSTLEDFYKAEMHRNASKCL